MISKLDEETALSILFANTRKKRRTKNLLFLAEVFDYLVKLYGTQKAVAEKVGLSTEMVREFLIPLRLPKEVQELVAIRKLDSLDVVREISAMREPLKQIAAAKMLKDSPSKDVRDVKRLINMANISVGNAKKIISDAKPKDLHIFVMDFDDEMYRLITKQAKDRKVKPAELVRNIVGEWLNKIAKQKE